MPSNSSALAPAAPWVAAIWSISPTNRPLLLAATAIRLAAPATSAGYSSARSASTTSRTPSVSAVCRAWTQTAVVPL